MSVATGVSMNSKYILPYMPGMKVAYSVAYRKNLSEKAKLKLHCYNLYKHEGMKVKDLSKVFGKDRATIYRWIKQSKKSLMIRRYQHLEPKSTRPKNTPRTKVIDAEVEKHILAIRDKLKCGKDNIHEYLKTDYGINISASSIGRYLKKLPRSKDPKYCDINQGKTKRTGNKDLLRIKDVIGLLKRRAWERFQIDTKYWVVNNRKFYVIVAIDTVTRMVFARAYTRHTANCARDFLRKLDYLFDMSHSQVYIQRDNGTEFMAEFEKEAENLGISLITNHARCPEMNGFVKSFNKILKNECLLYNSPETAQEANAILKDYIIRYNFVRIHGGLNKITPFEAYMEKTFLQPIVWIEKNLPSLSHMLWTYSNYLPPPQF